MNIQTILFIFIAYGLFATLYNGGTTASEQFPTFNPPQVPGFEQGSCNWWVLCTNVLADWVGLIAQSIVYVGLLLVEIIRMLVSVLILIVSNAFTGFSGAPIWVNALFIVGIMGSLLISVYKAIRKGDTDSA